MIHFLKALNFLFVEGYIFVFFWILRSILPLRRNWLVRIVGFLVFGYIADAIIYSNDIYALLGTLAAFFLYILVFYRGTFVEKISVLLVFYPALISINYLMRDIGMRVFYAVAEAAWGETKQSPRLLLLDNGILVFSLFLRLLFWVGIWLILRKFISKITARLTQRMWLIVDMLMLASFVAVFTILLFMPEDTIIMYPICGASLFSSFGCVYLASYICGAAENAWRVQELERRGNYYKDRIRDEERVRSIYHDLKNHLLVLQSEAQGTQSVRSIQTLQDQIEGYENYYHTGNEVVDIIIRDKAKRAQERQIDFVAAVSFEDGAFLEVLDISTIFGNALDNAIEASEKLPEEQRLITVRAGRVRDMLLIAVENHVSPSMRLSGKTTKEDDFLHGLGLPNIRKAVERYDGQCSVKSEDGVFTLKIVIPVPDAGA